LVPFFVCRFPYNDDPLTPLSYNCSCDLSNVTLPENITDSMITKDNCTNYNGTQLGDGCDTPVYHPDVFFFSVILFIFTFLLAYTLKMSRAASFFPTVVSVRIFFKAPTGV
jgi:hypothetical protein